MSSRQKFDQPNKQSKKHSEESTELLHIGKLFTRFQPTHKYETCLAYARV